MRAGYLRNIAIITLVLSVGIVFLSGQMSQAAASAYPTDSCYWYYNSYYYWGYYGYPYYSYGYPYWCYNGYYGYSGYYGYYNYYSPPPAKYQLTVATDPSTLGTATGNGTYTSGDSASFTVTQSIIQTSANTRYVFSHWTGDYSGVGTSGSITMNGARKVIAVYQLQYHLSVGVHPLSAPLPQGEGWYNAGDTATLSVNAQILGGQDGSRLVFQGWSVDGSGVQASATLPVTMDAAHVVTAQYKQQYYLKVMTDQGVAYGEGWHDAGSTAQIYVSTPVSTEYGVNIVFNGWQGAIQSSSQSSTVVMDQPKTVIASWRSDPTVLNLTIILSIVVALLIVGGVLAYVVLSRRPSRLQPAKPVPTQATPTKTSDVSPPVKKKSTPVKKKPPENTETPDSESGPS
jgi:hypothetical protein